MKIVRAVAAAAHYLLEFTPTLMTKVVVYSKPGCCLCERVKAQLTKLREKHSFELRELNILDDPEIYEQFKEEIPVVFVNGRKAFKYRLDERKFIRMIGHL
jgi:glutaredoxin